MQYIISESDIEIKDAFYTGSLSALAIHPDGRPYHTFRTATVLVDGNNITFRKCIFENTAGPGKEAGQAIALYLDGDGISLYDCTIRGHQDTLFLAPLPPYEYEKDGFLGPKQHTPRTPRSFYFENCIIEGGVDFIFGGAAALFVNCEFRSAEEGYVFAPSTPEGQKTGFVARGCRFTAAPGVPEGSVYLARPWREYARVRIEDCYMDSHINSAGWNDWGKDVHDTILFEETGSFGPGAVTHRPSFS